MMAAVGLRLRRSLTSPILIATFQQNTNIVVNESKPKAIRSSGWKFSCLAGPRMGDYGFIYPITKGSPEYVALNLTPDDLLTYEGCDYNHWMIVMDIRYLRKPKKRLETYVQTAAKVLGSVEEANKKIYAVMYSGFQVEVSEEVAQQFKGLPGVLQVLPDSYIDPDNKEYGGDKYVNGTIIPRPPDRWKRAQPRLVRHPGSSSCMRPEIIQFISDKMEEYKLRRYGK